MAKPCTNTHSHAATLSVSLPLSQGETHTSNHMDTRTHVRTHANPDASQSDLRQQDQSMPNAYHTDYSNWYNCMHLSPIIPCRICQPSHQSVHQFAQAHQRQPRSSPTCPLEYWCLLVGEVMSVCVCVCVRGSQWNQGCYLHACPSVCLSLHQPSPPNVRPSVDLPALSAHLPHCPLAVWLTPLKSDRASSSARTVLSIACKLDVKALVSPSMPCAHGPRQKASQCML